MQIPNFKFLKPPELDVSIVIVSFNTREILLRCLESIKKQTTEISYEIIVIDNSSKDQTVEAIAEKFCEIGVISNKVNRGFSAANNQGILSSKGKKIAFLNPDTLLTENSFGKILKYMKEHPEFSILGSGIVDKNNNPCPIRLWEDTPQDAALKILSLYDPSRELEKMGEMKAKEVQVISGCCFVVARELIESVGLMDENYFLYNEEDDFCRRARQNGKKICFFPETSVQHLHGQSTHQNCHREKVIVETYRSNVYFYSKYYSFSWSVLLRLLYKVTFLLGLLNPKFFYIKNSRTVDESFLLKVKLLLMSPEKKNQPFYFF
ncbi:MAG: glycosyltransferase family 2 protein [Nitrospina sp.]|nr:glycosyltransferase family 2 protein [Nitrospina sp.]MBT6602214.1 glycosyltransferase family 2 protein [Nitrospina sp.]